MTFLNDHVKNMALASIAAIPVIGGSISILVDKYLPSELEKRKNKLIEQFDQDIEDIKSKIDPARLESEAYITIFFKVFKNAIEEHNQEKIKKFRAILKNTALSVTIENPEIEFYIKLVNELTITHLKILRFIYNGDFYDRVTYIHLTEDSALQELCVIDLERLNLIIIDKSTVYNRDDYLMSALGNRFYKFIEL